MTIKIKRDQDSKEISISCGKIKPIIAANDSETWNTTAINNFLIKIAANNPLDEEIKVLPQVIDVDDKDIELTFVIQLFQEFASEFNLEIKTMTQNEENDLE